METKTTAQEFATTTLLDGETYQLALARRYAEEEATDVRIYNNVWIHPSEPSMLNYDPSDPDKMKLPAGKTCGHCAHIKRCKAMFGHVETDTDCDWSPSRFAEAPEEPTNPYLRGLALVKIHSGTSGQGALAKCILSLYNSDFYWFPIGDILAPLDAHYTEVVLAMIHAYAEHGETAELRQAGEYCYHNFPRLVELSQAMNDARAEVRAKWEREREEENRRLYPEDYQ